MYCHCRPNFQALLNLTNSNGAETCSKKKTTTKQQKTKTAERHTADRHVSVGHLNFFYWQPHARESTPYRAAGAGPPAISTLSPILRWRPGPELRQEGKAGAQRLSGSSLHSRIMPQIGSRSAHPFCAMEKHTGSDRHEQHSKHILKNGAGGMAGGELGWLHRGRQEQLFTGAPPPPL